MSQVYTNSEGFAEYKHSANTNLRKWVIRMVHLWPVLLISVFICLLFAYLYLRYATPIYRSVASLMVQDESKGVSSSEAQRLKELGLSNDSKLVVNEIEMLKSYDLIELVVDSLDLYVAVKRKGKIRDVDIFENEVPFVLHILNPEQLDKPKKWKLFYEAEKIFFTGHKEKQQLQIKYGETYTSGGIQFRVMPNGRYIQPTGDGSVPASNEFSLIVNAPKASVIEYNRKLLVEQANKLATVINLEIKDANSRRAKDFLETLLFVYNQQEYQNKNKVTEKTVAFLDDRLAEVASDLRAMEGGEQQYKSANRVTNLSSDAELYLDLSRTVDLQKAEVQTQLNIINALDQNLQQSRSNPQVVPSNFGIQDPALSQLIEKHNNLVLQKQRIEERSGPKNPLVVEQNNQLQELRENLSSSVQNLKKAYAITLGNISQKDAQLSNRIRNVPQIEKNLIQITRSKKVQEELYAYLLQKKEEASVARASTIEDFQTIAQARELGLVSPKPKLILTAGFLIGLMLPVAFVSIRDFMNGKIGDRLQVEQATDIPLLGIVSHVKQSKPAIVINTQSRTAVAEQLRNIRTALNLATKHKPIQTLMVTSFQPGDGKSFISLNLAASYALLNKKTVMLEFDLRRPHISKDMGLNGKGGISEVLTMGIASLSHLLTEVEGFNNSLFVMSAGKVNANPAELISGSNIAELFALLREQFDYIIINTPPVGLVADAALLQQYADATLVVLRQGHTSQEVYTEINTKFANQKDHPVYLILNDVGKKKYGYTSYRDEKMNAYYQEA